MKEAAKVLYINSGSLGAFMKIGERRKPSDRVRSDGFFYFHMGLDGSKVEIKDAIKAVPFRNVILATNGGGL